MQCDVLPFDSTECKVTQKRCKMVQKRHKAMQNGAKTTQNYKKWCDAPPKYADWIHPCTLSRDLHIIVGEGIYRYKILGRLTTGEINCTYIPLTVLRVAGPKQVKVMQYSL